MSAKVYALICLKLDYIFQVEKPLVITASSALLS